MPVWQCAKKTVSRCYKCPLISPGQHLLTQRVHQKIRTNTKFFSWALVKNAGDGMIIQAETK